MLFPEVLNITITGNKRPGLVLHSSYNLRINLILLVECCISVSISPHLSIIYFMEKCQGWRGEGTGRTHKQADTDSCMMNLVCRFSSQNIQPHFIITWLEAIQKTVKEFREIQGYRPSGERHGSEQKEKRTLLCMQIILNCQELRILMRTKYEREVSIQKTGKKISYILETSITQWVRNLVNSISHEQNRNKTASNTNFQLHGNCRKV